MRPKTILMALLLLLAGFRIVNWEGFSGLLTVFVLLWGSAVMAFNDWCDRNHDKKKGKDFAARTGNKYVGFFVLLWAATILVAFLVYQGNQAYGYISGLLTVMGLMYFATRKVFLLSSIWVALSSSAVTFYALIPQSSPKVFILFLSTFMFILGREILEDVDDIYIDRGYKNTLPLKVGASRAKILACFPYVLSYIGFTLVTFRAFYVLFFGALSIGMLVMDRDQKVAKYINDAVFILILFLILLNGV